ncbi:MAG: hypothetical protein PHE24_02050 [Patescibacteria group bacterium]|nr:hypothetical protein [Patescibacteria group bacterium]
MNKKNIYIIIIAAVAVFLMLFTALFVFNSLSKKVVINLPPGISNNPGGTKPPAVTGSSSSAFPLDLAKKNNDISQCASYKIPKYIDQCIKLVAENSQNQSFCASISDKSLAQDCVDWVIRDQAVSANKISLCNQIKSDAINQNCVATVINNVSGIKRSDCEALPSREKPYCVQYFDFTDLMDQLNNAKTAADCQQISQPEYKNECLRRVNH